MLAETLETGDNAYVITLAALDIKDEFLQVPQEKLVEVSLYNQKYIIKRNLPGQRLGAKAWYWFFQRLLWLKPSNLNGVLNSLV